MNRCFFGQFGIALALMAGSIAPSASAVAQTAASGSLGTPPSGEIPIIFDDAHVYANPDTLRSGRVLAALVRNGVLLVPLRSLFERLDATVSWDAARRTAEISKPGSDVKVTVGRPVVVVNGEERPLDVPPAIYRGAVVVPVRVISEAMGAYVQWVPERRVVVVRYLAAPVPTPSPVPFATPASSPVPIAVPTPVVTASPSPPPTQRPEAFVAGDSLISPKIYDELSAGNTGTKSYDIRGAIEIPLGGLPLMIEGDYRHYRFPHDAAQSVGACVPGAPGSSGCGTVIGNAVYQTGLCPSADPGCVTVVGFQQIAAFNGLGQAYVPAFTAYEDEGDVRVGIRVAQPRVYVGAAYFAKTFSYLGYPRISGAGFGITKLPDLDRPVSLEGSAWYYPQLSGNYTYPTTPLLGSLSGQTIPLTYAYWKYRAGATVNLGASGIFLGFGVAGERGNARTNAPAGTSVNAPYAGIGIHF